MPNTYEVTGPDGQLYEVQANSHEEAASAFDKPTAQPAAAPASRGLFDNMFSSPQSVLAEKMTQEGKGVEDTAQAQLGAYKTTGSGVAEGAKQLVAGVKQFGSSIQDAYKLFVQGKPIRNESFDPKTGKRDTSLLESSAEKQTVAAELLRQATDEAEAGQDKSVSLPGRRIVAGATQMGALAAAPELLPGKAVTATGAIARNAAMGAASGSLVFNSDMDNKDALVGALAAPVFGVIPSLAPAVKNWLGRGFSRAVSEGRTAARVANAEATLPNTKFSLAQKTGIPELVSLQRSAYNSDMVNDFANQTDNFISDAVTALRQPVKAGQTLDNDFVAARTKADKALTELKRTASSNYERGVAAAEGMTPGFVQVDGLRDAFGPIEKQSKDVLASGGRTIMPEAFMSSLKKTLFSEKGTARAMSSNELARAMKGLTALQKSEDPVQRAMASKLREGLDADLDHMQETISTGGKADASIKQLLDTRAEYRRAMQAADQLGNSASYKLLGVNDQETGSDTLLSKLKGMTPEKRTSVRTFMEANSPDLLVSMKQAAIDEAQKHAQTIRSAADSQQDLSQMLDSMFDAKNGYDLRTSGIWNADELKVMEGIKDGLRVVANGRPLHGGAGTAIQPADIAPNLISRSEIFIARQAARILTGSKLSKFFFDEDLFKMLKTTNRSTTGGPTNMIARAALLDRMQSDYLEDSDKQ